MSKDLIIQSSPTDIEIAILEDEQLVELHKEKTNQQFSVGDIILGRVKKIVPGLNAAFVDIGYKKDAFLHYTDMGPTFSSLSHFLRGIIKNKLKGDLLTNFKLQPQIDKHGSVDKVLKNNYLVLVQILKEPISTKGHRLTSEITIPGRNLVLVPFTNSISISKRISNEEERKRLRLLIESIRPKNFGVIVRTAAEGKKVAELHEEVDELSETWRQLQKKLHNAKAPQKLLSELNKTSSILRDMLNDSFSKIVIDDPELANNTKDFLSSIAPTKSKLLQEYKGDQGVFDKFGITRQIKSSFGKTSTMKSGAYLVIEHTEAMHVIDVNSGPKMQRGDQEETALKVNLEAAKEISRQLRLRDIGGLIIIDFIDMRKRENRQKLIDSMKEYMSSDRAQHTILPLSRFGLMQITRQRTRPAVKIDTSEHCPACGGTGKTSASILVMDDIERDLKYLLKTQQSKKLTLEVHPFLHAFIKKGLPNKQQKWYFNLGKWVKLRINQDLGLTEYKFFDQTDDEIRLQ